MRTRVAAAVAAAAVLMTGAPAGAVERVTPRAVDAYVQRMRAESGVPGMSVVVTHGRRVVRAAGYGHGSDGRPVTGRTPMRVASLTKAFTAAAVLRLVRQGRIGLDRPVAAQLPGFRLADPRGARITVRQVLNQTSGLTDQATGIDVASGGIGSLRAEVARLRTARLAWAPGTRWAYCNINYDIAARLVETASGRSYAAYVRDHLFAPLGMDGSAIGNGGRRPAEGYTAAFGLWVARRDVPGLLSASGAGGVVTDAHDLGRWLIAQGGHAPHTLPPGALRVMHTPGPGTGDHRYAMGWQVERDRSGHVRLTHTGNLFTYFAAAAVVPSTGYGVAVMVNGAGLADASWPTMEGLVALTEGRAPSGMGSGPAITQVALAALTAVAIALGVLGGVRARRWARRRSGAGVVRAAVRLVPVLVPVAVLAAYPWLVAAISAGRRLTWPQLTYFTAPVTIVVAAAGLAGLGTAALRVAALARVRRTQRWPAARSVGSPR